MVMASSATLQVSDVAFRDPDFSRRTEFCVVSTHIRFQQDKMAGTARAGVALQRRLAVLLLTAFPPGDAVITARCPHTLVLWLFVL